MAKRKVRRKKKSRKGKRKGKKNRRSLVRIRNPRTGITMLAKRLASGKLKFIGKA